MGALPNFRLLASTHRSQSLAGGDRSFVVLRGHRNYCFSSRHFREVEGEDGQPSDLSSWLVPVLHLHAFNALGGIQRLETIIRSRQRESVVVGRVGLCVTCENCCCCWGFNECFTTHNQQRTEPQCPRYAQWPRSNSIRRRPSSWALPFRWSFLHRHTCTS